MDKVCYYFDKDFEYFIKKDKIVNNNIEKNDGSVVGFNYGIINFFFENIIGEIKKFIDENKQKDELIKVFREENKIFRDKK